MSARTTKLLPLIAAALLSTTAAQAQVIGGVAPQFLYTAPLSLANPDDGTQVNVFHCNILNVAGAIRKVRLRVKDSTGKTLMDSGDRVIANGTVTDTFMSTGVSPGVNFTKNLYCQFTVYGEKTDVRANATIHGAEFFGAGDYSSDIVSVVAQ